jgi:hypothetical protein
MPNELSGQMGALYHCSYEFGFLLGVIIGIFIPHDYIYLAFLVTEIFALISIAMLLTVFKEESPTYL